MKKISLNLGILNFYKIPTKAIQPNPTKESKLIIFARPMKRIIKEENSPIKSKVKKAVRAV
jgi:hypothetical protein